MPNKKVISGIFATMRAVRLGVLSVFCLAFTVFGGCAQPAPVPTAPPEPTVHTAKLVFVGDVMSHTPQVTAARTSDGGYDYSDVFRHVRPIFEDADIVIANLETTLRTAPPYTGYPTFAAPAELAFAMRDAGIDIAVVANNHICDKGRQGILSTMGFLDSARLGHTGVFTGEADRNARNPLRFTADGIRFALLNYTYGTNGLPVPSGTMVNLIDTAVIARDLAASRRDSTDCVIVSYHWGEEYHRTPTRAQRELAAWTRAHGADIIIGGHPHVVEPFEAYYNADSTAVTGATYYSLGNFVSNQRRRYTDGGMIAEIVVTKTVTTDSLSSNKSSLGYDFGYRLVWVNTPVRAGVRRYEVLPAAVADTLPAAATFLRDTRALLSTADPVFTELE